MTTNKGVMKTYQDTIQQLFLLKCHGKLSKDQSEILKQYVIYYINAPVFNSDYIDVLRSKVDLSMTLDELIFECIDYGLDPF